jgi:hypothetical protein
MSDDTLHRPFSVDYLTKYRMPAGEVDSLPNDSDLEEVPCNESKQEVQVNDLFPEIDARYDQTDGVLEKEFDDWQITIDTAHHPRRPDLVVGDPVLEDKSTNNAFEGDFTPGNNPIQVPAQQVESRINAGTSDDSEVPVATEDLGEGEMGASEKKTRRMRMTRTITREISMMTAPETQPWQEKMATRTEATATTTKEWRTKVKRVKKMGRIIPTTRGTAVTVVTVTMTMMTMMTMTTMTTRTKATP